MQISYKKFHNNPFKKCNSQLEGLNNLIFLEVYVKS